MIESQARIKNRKGASSIEFVLVAIPFFLFLFGIIEFGQLSLTKDLMTEAAREAARYASVNTNVTGSDENDMSTAAIESKIRDMVVGQPIDDLTISFSHPDDPSTNWKTGATLQHQIEVTVSANYRPLTPVLYMLADESSASIPIQATAIAYSEGH